MPGGVGGFPLRVPPVAPEAVAVAVAAAAAAAVGLEFDALSGASAASVRAGSPEWRDTGSG